MNIQTSYGIHVFRWSFPCKEWFLANLSWMKRGSKNIVINFQCNWNFSIFAILRNRRSSISWQTQLGPKGVFFSRIGQYNVDWPCVGDSINLQLMESWTPCIQKFTRKLFHKYPQKEYASLWIRVVDCICCISCWIIQPQNQLKLNQAMAIVGLNHKFRS